MSPSIPVSTLRLPNFRRYVAVQLAGGAGTWNQRIAELWLLLELTGDGLSLGLGTALRTAPAIFLGAWAGALADRHDRRKLLILTQASRGAVGAFFALVTFRGVPDVSLVYGLVLALGVIAAIDGPIRRSFVRDVVDQRDLRAAASLHTATISIGRVFGPLVAGLLISRWGVDAAFLASVGTAVIAVEALRRVEPLSSASGKESEPDEQTSYAASESAQPGLRRGRPRIRDVFVLLAVFSTFGWNLDVVLPIVAEQVLGRGPLAFSALVICLSVGSFLGSIVATAMPSTGLTTTSLVLPLVGFGASLLLVAVSSVSLVGVAGALIVSGLMGGIFLSAASAAVQTTANPATQGRVVAQYTVIFVGARAFGAPALGWLIDASGPRPAIATFGLLTAACGAGVGAILAFRGRRRLEASEPAAATSSPESQPSTEGPS